MSVVLAQPPAHSHTTAAGREKNEIASSTALHSPHEPHQLLLTRAEAPSCGLGPRHCSQSRSPWSSHRPRPQHLPRGRGASYSRPCSLLSLHRCGTGSSGHAVQHAQQQRASCAPLAATHARSSCAHLRREQRHPNHPPARQVTLSDINVIISGGSDGKPVTVKVDAVRAPPAQQQGSSGNNTSTGGLPAPPPMPRVRCGGGGVRG